MNDSSAFFMALEAVKEYYKWQNGFGLSGKKSMKYGNAVLIQTNMDMLQGNYTALLYSSLKEGEKSEHHSVRLTQFQ